MVDGTKLGDRGGGCHLPSRRHGFRSLGRKDPLKKEMATFCSFLVWEIPWTEELGGLQSMGSHESQT